jgi:hypothetical protein
MVLLLAEQLRLPLRERNAMLLAAGFAPAFGARDIAAPEMSQVRDAVMLVLENHEPFPAMALDRRGNVIFSNSGAKLLAEGVAADLLGPPVNVYRISLHPRGMRERIRDFEVYARHMVMRLRHDAGVSADPGLQSLLSEVESYQAVRPGASTSVTGQADVVLPLCLSTSLGELAFFSTIATFGTPLDVTVAELAIESFFPADEATARRVRRLAK